MKLVENWKSVLQMAWSIKLAVLSAMFGAVELTLPLFQQVVPPKTFAYMSLVTAVMAAVSRVVKQEKTLPPQ